MSTYSIYIMQLYDSIYNLLLVVWVLPLVICINTSSLRYLYLKPTA